MRITTKYYPVGTYSSNGEDSSESTPVTYHVTFQNYDGTTLYETDVEEGQAAIYVGEIPTKASDDEYDFTFIGWDKDLSSINADIVTKATYEKTATPWGPMIWVE